MATETVLKDKSVWESEELLTGTDAVAQAVRLADVDVFAAYPIRPYTGVMDRLSKFFADAMCRRHGRRLSDALPTHGKGANKRGCKQVPPSLRSWIEKNASRQSNINCPTGKRGLGNGD